MEFINPKKIFGLGTGSTVNFLIQKIHESYILKGQPINAVSTSRETTCLAESLGINILDLDQVDELDLVIDGADAVGPENNLVNSSPHKSNLKADFIDLAAKTLSMLP